MRSWHTRGSTPPASRASDIGPNLTQPDLEIESPVNELLLEVFNPFQCGPAGDINGDGIADIGVGDLSGTKLRIYLGAPLGMTLHRVAARPSGRRC